MTDTSELIERAAREVCRSVEAIPCAGNTFIVAHEIWLRVLIERERCAKLVDHRVALASELSPEAAAAVFAALSAAIRSPETEKPA